MIELRHIDKYYKDSHVLRDVSLTLKKGEIYGLIGQNGAGKTTIFKIILGLTKYQNGKLQIASSQTDKEVVENRQKIGFFIGHHFFPYLNARDNLTFYCQIKGIKDLNEIDRVLNLVGLSGNDKPYRSYSMGMKQRLGIANALLGNPEILILDEPTNGLDPQGIAAIRQLIQKLNQDYGMTILVSSHILGELEHTAHRFGIIHGGRVVKELTADDLKTSNDLVQIRVDDVERAKSLLLAEGIAVLEETVLAKSLEQYYFETVGGSDA